MKIDDILNDLESMTALFKNYKELNGEIQIPIKCFKKVIRTKINNISSEIKTM